MSETLTFDEKVAQVKEVVKQDEKLTDIEEFDIIEGKGIEYILKAQGLPDLKVYIAPLKIAQYRLFYDIETATRTGKPIPEIINITSASFAKIFNIEQATLENYLDRDDIEKISTLLGCGVYLGKAMFKKKHLSMSEAVSLLSNGMKANRG